MDARLLSVLRFLRLSIVLIGLMPFAALSEAASVATPFDQHTLQKIPAQQLHAARPAHAAILTAKLSVVSSGKPPFGDFPYMSAAEAASAIKPDNVCRLKRVNYSRLLLESLICERPRARSPPLV